MGRNKQKKQGECVKQQIYLQSGQHSVGSETMPNRMEELVASALAIGASLGVLALPFGGLMVTFF